MTFLAAGLPAKYDWWRQRTRASSSQRPSTLIQRRIAHHQCRSIYPDRTAKCTYAHQQAISMSSNFICISPPSSTSQMENNPQQKKTRVKRERAKKTHNTPMTSLAVQNAAKEKQKSVHKQAHSKIEREKNDRGSRQKTNHSAMLLVVISNDTAQTKGLVTAGRADNKHLRRELSLEGSNA